VREPYSVCASRYAAVEVPDTIVYAVMDELAEIPGGGHGAGLDPFVRGECDVGATCVRVGLGWGCR
jgi:hypothetical protein